MPVGVIRAHGGMSRGTTIRVAAVLTATVLPAVVVPTPLHAPEAIVLPVVAMEAIVPILSPAPAVIIITVPAHTARMAALLIWLLRLHAHTDLCMLPGARLRLLPARGIPVPAAPISAHCSA